jgi:hypothetical protein
MPMVALVNRHLDMVRELEDDEVIIEMAKEIPPYIMDNNIDILSMFHEYKKRGGKLHPHIGGPKEAVVNIRRRMRGE